MIIHIYRKWKKKLIKINQQANIDCLNKTCRTKNYAINWSKSKKYEWAWKGRNYKN